MRFQKNTCWQYVRFVNKKAIEKITYFRLLVNSTEYNLNIAVVCMLTGALSSNQPLHVKIYGSLEIPPAHSLA